MNQDQYTCNTYLQTSSQVLPPDVYSRLRGHLAWVKDQMSGWVTNQQRNRGLHPDYLFRFNAAVLRCVLKTRLNVASLQRYHWQLGEKAAGLGDAYVHLRRTQLQAEKKFTRLQSCASTVEQLGEAR